MFGRLLDIKISNDNGEVLTLVDHTQGNKSLIGEADITCMPNDERTSAIIKIYNLDSATRGVIKTGEYKYINIEFGYKDLNGGEVSSIFNGTLQRMITQRPSPETSLTLMYAYELGDAYSYGFYSGEFPAGTSLYDVVNTIATQGKIIIPIDVTETFKNIYLSKAKSYYGGQIDLLEEIANSVDGIIFMQTMGKVTITTSTENLQTEVILMSGADVSGNLVSSSGLIGLPSLEDDGLSFECLVNPKLRIYGSVLIANAFISDAQEGFVSSASAGAEYDENGLYVVVRIETHVTNGPTESKMRVRALSRSYYLDEEEE